MTCDCTQFIERKSNVKYLEVFLDENLTWKEHVGTIRNQKS